MKEKKERKKNNNNCFVFVCCFMKFETAAALSEGQEITYFGVCLLLQKLADCCGLLPCCCSSSIVAKK